ncbi:MAG TPA: hypothetical protein PLY40_05605 [Bacillota bacterium]|nr:hypothetical protein [Bacillota bacterium]
MKAYKLEIWVTAVCLALVSVAGGFASSLFVIFRNSFFNRIATPGALVPVYGETMYVVDKYILCLPLHYFLLIVLSWIGVTLIGAIWCLIMDKLEERQRT